MALSVHGGTDALGATAHDFSTNSNACGPCPMALEAVRKADASRYPDPHYTALREALAHWHGVAPQRLWLAASASEFIFRISAAAARHGLRAVHLPAHGYGDYGQAAAAWALQPAQPGMPALHWHCDPFSPLGSAMDGACWSVALDGLQSDGAMVLDLAYEPLRLDGALAMTTAQRDSVWQLWTPNKALGLTGVRAAYAIAPLQAGDWPQTLQALAPSWPLGAHGVAMLQAWIQPQTQDWLVRSRAQLRDWRSRQRAMCEEQLGWQVQPTAANFFCAQPRLRGQPLTAEELAVHAVTLRQAGIKLRDAASFGLPGQVRLGVLPPASQDALCSAWQALH